MGGAQIPIDPPLCFTTPKLRLTSPLSQYQTLDLQADLAIDRFVTGLETQIQQQLVERSEELFGELYDSTTVSSMFVSYIKRSYHGDSFRVKMAKATAVFDADEQHIADQQITVPCLLRARVSCSQLWVMNRKMGMQLRLEQLKCYPCCDSASSSDSGFLSDT